MGNSRKRLDSAKQFEVNVNSMELSWLCSNVFGNSLILTEIFSHLESTNDLKNIRLVSSLWRSMSLKQWRRVGTVQLLWKENITFDCDYCQSVVIPNENQTKDRQPGLSIKEFLEVLKKSEQEGESCRYQLHKNPFTSFRIGCCSFLSQNRLNDAHLKTFLNVCGSQIKYLNLDHVIIKNVIYFSFEILREILCKKLPNLEELTMLIMPVEIQRFHPLDYSNYERWEDYNSFAIVGGTASSKLETITLGICQSSDGETVSRISEHLIKWLSCIPNIKNLNVDSKAGKYLEVLQNPNFQLKSLTLPVQEGCMLNSYNIVEECLARSKARLQSLKIGVDLMRDGRSGSVQDLLRSCGHTLQYLELGSYPMAMRGRSLGGHLKNITFPHLTKLYLFGEAVVSFRALRDVDNLQVLWIQADNCLFDWNRRIGAEAKEEANSGKLLWRKLIHFHCDYYRLTPDSLRVLGRWMPNLRSVQLFLRESTSELVLKVWPKAEMSSGWLYGEVGRVGEHESSNRNIM